MRVPLFWRVLPVHCLIAALLIVPIWQKNQAIAEAAEAGRKADSSLGASKAEAKPVISGVPTRIIIPRLGIDLSVIDGLYDASTEQWSVSSVAANYARNTPVANNKQDKTLIYGHRTSQIFGPTKNLLAGDKAYIYTSNGHLLKYSFSNTAVVTPIDITMFDKLKGEPGLVLMTCQGVWDQERRLMVFNLEQAK